MWPTLIVLGVLVALIVLQFNGIVRLRNLVRNAWSDMDVYLTRRAQLIPNLVEAVKAYASHEQTVLSAVTEARARAEQLHDPTSEKSSVESQLGGSLIRVMAIAEQYPELKANQNFAQLQEELTNTERLIASARQYYNACVRDFNTKIQAFPGNLFAGAMNLTALEFFELENVSERNVPKAELK